MFICSVLVLQQVDSAKLENKLLSRQKRTVLSTISNWWYGEPTTPVPVEDLPFKDDLNYVSYPYYNPTGVGGYPIQYIPQPQPPQSEDDLGRLARELGIRHIRNLPKIEEVMGLLGTNSKDETIQAIREFAETPGGVDMIESFLTPESDEGKDEYQPVNNVKQEINVPYSSNSVPVQNIIPTETVQKLPETLRTGVHQQKALNLPQSEEQKLDQTLDRFNTDVELAVKVPQEPSGMFGRIGYYANFLNPFSLTQTAEVPLPTEKGPDVTVRPIIYRYPEGYNPHTKSFTNSKTRVELLESEHKNLSGGSKIEESKPVTHSLGHSVNQFQSGPFVRFPQEIQPLIRTPQPQFPHNAIINAPIPAHIYQSGHGNPYFVDQHRLAAVPNPFQEQTLSVSPQSVPVAIDLTDDEYSPNQVQALRQQQQIKGQFMAISLPPVVNPAVTNFNGDDGSFNIDKRFGHPINVVDHVASESEVHETVVEKDGKEIKVTSTTEEPATTNKVTETLKLIPVQTSESSDVTSTTTEKTEEVADESTVNVVTVLPDNDFVFETFNAPKEFGDKVIEKLSNLTEESLKKKEVDKEQMENEEQ